jgi:alginate O-acetyltransferase complex protein AlgI
MLFNSHEFLFLFLPLTLLGYLAIGRYSIRWALGWLTLCSLFFYGWWNPDYLFLISSSIAINYFLGLQIRKSLSTNHAIVTRRILAVGVVLNLGLIGYFKYADFLVGTSNALLGTSWPMLNILLPIGISFFTFQQIAYLVDTAKGETARANLLEYAFFVAFFPQLIAGPIVNFKVIFPQYRHLRGNYRAFLANFSIGVSIFAVGLFKKVVIADSMAPIASLVFSAAESGQQIFAVDAWRAAFAYSLQIYFDFSGYSDMAIGLGRMFGFRLPINFNSPYKASSIIDFWRRWHITLSRFLRDYLYIPLGGNRLGRGRRYVNLLITMLLGGLWHGANWTFVVWGGLHGAYLAVNHGLRRISKRRINTWWSLLISRITTFLLVSFAWIFFRAESFSSALSIFRAMTELPANIATTPLLSLALSTLGFQFGAPAFSATDLNYSIWLIAWLMFIWYVPNTQHFLHYKGPHTVGPESSDPPLPTRWRPGLLRAMITGVILAIAMLGLSRVSEFIYFQF